MSTLMDLGTLVATLQVKDQDFPRVLARAADLARVTERKIDKSLGNLKLDADTTRFQRSTQDAARSAQASGKQIAGSFDAIDRALQGQTRAVQDNARAWAQNKLDPARIKELKDLGVATDDYVAAIAGVPSAQSKVRAALDGNASALQQLEQDTRSVAEAQRDFDRTVSQIASTLDKQSGAVSENTRVWAANKIGTDNLDVLEQMGVKTSEYVDAVVGVPGALQRMETALEGNGDALARLNVLTGQVSEAQRSFQLRQRAIGETTEDAARSVNQAAGLIDRAGDASSRATPLVGGLGQAFDRAKTAMIALFAADTFIDFVRDSVRAASDFEQSVGAVGAVFGETSGEIEDFAKTSATQIGVAKGEYQQMAAVFGSQLKNMGVAATELVPTTNKLVTLGADLAAQFGGTTSDAVAALGSLLRGERDPIEQYGVGIKQADINARLAADGLDGLTGAAGKQAELQTTLALLWEQTASAQGSFSRELDTLATKQQIANAKFEDTKAAIGEKLLPLWSEFTDLLANEGLSAVENIGNLFAGLLQVLGPIVGLFADLPGPVQATAIALGLVVLLNGPLGAMWVTLKNIATGAGAATLGITRFAASMRAALAVVGGPIGLAIIAATTALSFMGTKSDRTAASVEGLAAVVDDATGRLKANAQEIAINEIVANGLAQQYGEMGGNLEDLVAALLGNEDAQRRVNAATAEFEKYAKTNDDIALAKQFTEDLATGQGKIADAQEKGAIKAKLNEDAQAQLAKVQAEGGDAAEGAAAKWTDLTDAQKLNTDQAKFVTEKLKAAAEAAKELAESTEASKMLGDFKGKADDAARAADLFKIKLDELDGRSRSLDDATADAQATLAALRDAFKEGTKAATENAEAGNLNLGALKEWNVAALTATSDGRALYGELSNMADQHAATAAAAYNDAVAQGDSAGAMDKARAAANDGRQAFIDLAAQYLGGNVPAAEALADKLGIVDGTKIDDKFFQVIGDDKEAQDAVDRANAAVVNDKLFSIKADAVEALQQAQVLNETLNKIDGKTVKWVALGNVVIAIQGMDNYVQDTGTRGVTGRAGVAWTGGRVGDLLRGFSQGGKVDRDGRISGPGGGKDDLVVGFGQDGRPLRLSNEETIMNAQASRRWGPLFALMNAGRFAEGGRVGGGAAPAPAEEGGFGVTVQGEVTAPDPSVVDGAWGEIAKGVEDAWSGRIAPVLDDLQKRNTETGDEFNALAKDAAAPSWASIGSAVQTAQQGVIQPSYEALNAQTQQVGAQQMLLRDTVGTSWQSIQDKHATTLQNLVALAYTPMANWSSQLGVAQQTLAGESDAAWSQIGGTIQATYDGQIVPSWTGVQSFATATGSFFAGVSAGVGSASNQIIGELGRITAKIDEFFGMVNNRSGGGFSRGGVIPKLEGFASGGVLPGVDTGKDNQLFAGRSEEAVMVPQFTRAVGGAVGVDRINRLAESGLFQGFAKGGVIGDTVKGPVNDMIVDGAHKAIESGIDKLFSAVGGFMSNGNWGPGTDGSGLAANTQAARDFIVRNWGITNIGGVYGGSVPGSDHPIGKALDVMIANYMSAAGIAQGDSVANWFISNPNAFGTKYVIWRDRINENGAWSPYQHPSGSNDTLQHRDHVHLSFLTGGGAFAGQAVGDTPSEGSWIDRMLGKIGFAAPAGSASYNAGGGVEQWSGLGLSVLQRVGQYVGQNLTPFLGNMLNQIRTESGGDPNAINNYDSNAQRGDPSIGLLQVIGSTFRAALSGTPFEYLIARGQRDPEASMVASTLYSLRRYGSLDRAWRGVAYDGGGPLKPGYTLAYNGTGHDEWISTSKPEKTVAQDRPIKVTVVLQGGDVLSSEIARVSRVVVDSGARELELASTRSWGQSL